MFNYRISGDGCDVGENRESSGMRQLSGIVDAVTESYHLFSKFSNMNQIFVIFAICSTALLANVQPGYGFQCWLCSTETDKRCGDPFNNTAYLRKEECNPAYYSSVSNKYVCRKVKHHGNDNEVIISRMCVMDGDKENNPCSQNALSSYLKVEHCSTCDTDLCNSAPSAFTIGSSMFAPIVILLSKLQFF